MPRNARAGVPQLLAWGLLMLACGAGGPPNFVVIVFDDLGPRDLGDEARELAPNLHRLGAEGMRFGRAYAAAPVCSPSRVALLTGRHPSHYGLRTALHSGDWALPADAPSLARSLARAGYASAHFGKWHVGSAGPRALGFDHSVTAPMTFRNPVLTVDGVSIGRQSGHLTSLTTDRVLEFLESRRGQPFLANVWYHAPHQPWEPPAAWAAQRPPTQRGRREAVIAHADAQVARIVAKLQELGLETRTVVWITSDNGPPLQAHASGGRGAKRELYEGGLRVPLIVRWPGRIPAGSVHDGVVWGGDLLPTLAELGGLDPAAEGPAGRSLAPLLLGGAAPPRDEPLFWEHGTGTPDWAVLVGRRKLVRHARGAGGRAQLFDLATDPGEDHDLASERPDWVGELQAAYDRVRSQRR